MALDVFGIAGTTLAGSFEVEEAVAEGGFGVVYRAHHRGFRATVALKCLSVPAHMTGEQRDAFVTQFRKEAEILFRLSAAIPEVVRPLHIDVTTLPDGRFVPFLALEWLSGVTLADFLDERRDDHEPPLGLEAAMDLLQPIAAALARAHRFAGPDGVESIVHRDLKPANIFITNVGGDEGVKILDFGIAKVKKLVTEHHDTGRSLVGESTAFTPGYAAPEQWLPKRFGTTGTFTDVWGLALTLVETLSGLPPIDGELLVMRELALDEARRPTPRALGISLPDRAEKAFERALRVDPRQRTQRVEEFWTELESALGQPASLFLLEATRETSRSSPKNRPAAPSSSPPLRSSPARSGVQRAFAETQPASAGAARAMGDRALEGTKSARSELDDAPLLDLTVPEISALAPKEKPRPPPAPMRIPALEAPAGRRSAPALDPERAGARALDPGRDASRALQAEPSLARSPLESSPDDLGPSFETVPLAIVPQAPRLHAASAFRPAGEWQRRPAPAASRPALGEPAGVLGLALCIAAVERYLARETGQPYMLGPLRLAWIAGVVGIIGAAWMASRLLSRREG